MTEVEEKARELGTMLRESPECKRFSDASKALADNSDIKSLLEEVALKEKGIEEKMRKGIPVEPQEKHEFTSLREKAESHPAYVEFIEARRGYLALMKRAIDVVNEAAGALVEAQED